MRAALQVGLSSNRARYSVRFCAYSIRGERPSWGEFKSLAFRLLPASEGTLARGTKRPICNTVSQKLTKLLVFQR